MATEEIICRHKTAIRRLEFSRPIQIALDSGLIRTDWTVLDYGCGKGDDLRGLSSRGVECWGWDPIYSPDSTIQDADVVNLGYVVNVIENIDERVRVLRKAWEHARKLLIVSARLSHEVKSNDFRPHGDGFLTTRGTFQKFYSQQELRDWIDHELSVISVAASPGVFIIFRDEGIRQQFLSSQYRRKLIAPIVRKSDVLFEQYKGLLSKLSIFITERGRLPDDDEVDFAFEIKEKIGSLKRAFSVIRKVTGEEQWLKIIEERSQDLLIHLALQRFLGRPKFSTLPKDIRLDIQSFFHSYEQAWKRAEDLLFSAGNLENIDKACRSAQCGKLTPDALYIHSSALQLMPPILRIYEGCARNYVGAPEGANIIKLHRLKPKVSYLSYPDFDRDPHPSLHGALVVPLRDFDVKFWDWTSSDNPPILHRKEEFVSDDYPFRDRFQRLTKQEEKAGLYEYPHTIGRRQQWSQLLADKKLRIVGHRLIKSHSSQ